MSAGSGRLAQSPRGSAPLAAAFWLAAAIASSAILPAQVQTPDEVYGEEEMAHARHHLLRHNGGQSFWMILADRFEWQNGDDEGGVFDLLGWFGGDRHRVAVETEGEYSSSDSEFEEVEFQIAYTRAISTYFDLKLGLRHDFEPTPSRTLAVFGVQGLAPYWFEIDAEAFLSEDGDLEARLEAEYELLFTQRLIGQVRTEVEVGGSADRELGFGAGLRSGELGLRLRYEIRREFAPYVGVEHHWLFGDTGDLARADGKETSGRAVVAGFRFWV